MYHSPLSIRDSQVLFHWQWRQRYLRTTGWDGIWLCPSCRTPNALMQWLNVIRHFFFWQRSRLANNQPCWIVAWKLCNYRRCPLLGIAHSRLCCSQTNSVMTSWDMWRIIITSDAGECLINKGDLLERCPSLLNSTESTDSGVGKAVDTILEGPANVRYS